MVKLRILTLALLAIDLLNPRHELAAARFGRAAAMRRNKTPLPTSPAIATVVTRGKHGQKDSGEHSRFS
jgi:hypothetical protein